MALTRALTSRLLAPDMPFELTVHTRTTTRDTTREAIREAIREPLRETFGETFRDTSDEASLRLPRQPPDGGSPTSPRAPGHAVRAARCAAVGPRAGG